MTVLLCHVLGLAFCACAGKSSHLEEQHPDDRLTSARVIPGVPTDVPIIDRVGFYGDVIDWKLIEAPAAMTIEGTRLVVVVEDKTAAILLSVYTQDLELIDQSYKPAGAGQVSVLISRPVTEVYTSIQALDGGTEHTLHRRLPESPAEPADP